MELVIPDRWHRRSRDSTHDLTSKVKAKIRWLSGQLCAAEAWLDDWAIWLKRLAATDGPNQPEGPWWLDIRISLVLDDADPEYEQDSDNTICEMYDTILLRPGDSSPCYPIRDWSQDFDQEHPLLDTPHCWLARTLMGDHEPELGWLNASRIGSVWVQALLSFGRAFPRNADVGLPTSSRPDSHGIRVVEGDNWRSFLSPKRVPGHMAHDMLTRSDIARIEELNARLARVQGWLKDCGQWFHAARTSDIAGAPDLEDNCWDAEVHLDFQLDTTDEVFQPGGDNTLHIATEQFASGVAGRYQGSGFFADPASNWNEFRFWPDNPLHHQHHCWLFHDLYDHSSPTLGWQNILRIGEVRAHTRIRLSQSFPPM